MRRALWLLHHNHGIAERPGTSTCFRGAGVHRQYAERFMQPERIETVPVEKCLGA
jgi:hypothetical protein